MSPKAVPWTSETRPNRWQAWCYLCSSEHRFHEPCTGTRPRLKLVDAYTKPCVQCGAPFKPSSFARSHHVYCSETCKHEARLARRREARK